MKSGAVVAILVFLGTLIEPAPSHAYTISVNCVPDAAPPAGRPVDNVVCTYAWAVGGTPNHAFGKVAAYLQLWPTTQFLHNIQTPIFLFQSYTSPLQTWIKCTSSTGTFRVYMDGYLYRYVVGTLSSSGHYVQEDYKSDAEFATVVTPLVTC